MRYLAWVPGEYFGGCEDYALRVAERARATGWAVTIVCAHATCAEALRRRTDTIRVVETSRVSVPGRFRGRRRVEDLFTAARHTMRLLAERPHVVHAVLPSHTDSADFIRTCSRLRMPLLVTFQLVAPGATPPRASAEADRAARARGARFCATSDDNRRWLCTYYGFEPGEVPVIPNRPRLTTPVPLDAEARRRVRQELGIDDGARVVLTVARLHSQKGHDLIIDAVPAILRAFPTAVFVWAGDGEWREHLSRLAATKHVERRIRMLGQRSDVRTLLAAADLFLFPTRYEGQSFALGEAVAGGVPVVASTASGIPELVRDGADAFLFPVGDVERLADAVVAALSDPREAARRAASAQRRLNAYTEEDMLRETLSTLAATARRPSP